MRYGFCSNLNHVYDSHLMIAFLLKKKKRQLVQDANTFSAFWKPLRVTSRDNRTLCLTGYCCYSNLRPREASAILSLQ